MSELDLDQLSSHSVQPVVDVLEFAERGLCSMGFPGLLLHG
jgi:hypothetical protein